MNKNKKFAFYSLVALLTSTTITAFSLTDRAKAQEQTQTQLPRSAERRMNMRTEVDKPFIEMMIPHHQSANEMAQMALSRAKSPEVKKLAQSIIEEQTREIEQMQTWYKQWYGTEVPTTEMNMGMDSGMDESMMQAMMQMEMMDREMMEALENAQDFDREFLRQMTRHHQTATMMAGMVVNSAQHREIRNLARNIIESQSAEIAQMQQLLQAMNNPS
jgi:uncharacterized protein (DUF305 family)